MKRKIILNLAISLDGYIADNEGGFAWITGDGDTSHDTKKKFDFPKFMEEVDTIVMGSKAYEACPPESRDSFNPKKIYVATTRKLKKIFDDMEFISGDICKKILALREEKGKDIWIFGGGISADLFIKADIIDEYIVGIIPIILGEGIPLFLDKNPQIKLHLDEYTSQEGIVILKYTKRKK